MPFLPQRERERFANTECTSDGQTQPFSKKAVKIRESRFRQTNPKDRSVFVGEIDPFLEAYSRKAPKPDVFLSFPVYPEIDNIEREETKIFLLAKLIKLEEKGCFPSVLTPLSEVQKNMNKLDKQNKSRLDRDVERSIDGGSTKLKINNKLRCYPWAIAEIKPHDCSEKVVRKCYYQMANGASVALTLREILLEYLSKDLKRKKHDSDDEPCIVGLTFIGPKVKLWLAYAEKVNKRKPQWRTWSSRHVSITTRTPSSTADTPTIAHIEHLGW